MADSTQRFLLLFLVMSSVFREITSKASSSSSGNDEAFPAERHGCYDPRNLELEELKSRVSALESIITDRAQELHRKEETIQSMERTIREKSETIESLQSEIDFIQSASSAKHKSKGEEQVYQLEKQIFKLKREAEKQSKRRLELETRSAELSSKLENLLKVNVEQKQRIQDTEHSLESTEMNWEWLSYKLHFHRRQAQAYLVTQWFKHLRPALYTTVHKLSDKIDQLQRWSEPHIETLNSKWIPNVKDTWLTISIYLEPKIQSLTNKSIKAYHMSKQALTPYLIQALDVLYNNIQVAKRHVQPYTSRVVTAAKPHLDKVHVAFEPYAEHARHAFTKLLNSTTVYHQQAQELLKENKLTKPVATIELAWFVATALLSLPLIFIIKLFSAISVTKQKRDSHKHHAVNGHRRAKRRHPYH